MFTMKDIEEKLGKFPVFLAVQFEYIGEQMRHNGSIAGHCYNCPTCSTTMLIEPLGELEKRAFEHYITKCTDYRTYDPEEHATIFQHYLTLDHNSQRRLTH